MAHTKGPRKIMVIRHAEKPGTYSGANYNGVDQLADKCGASGAKDLTTTGWQRAGGLVTLFAAPHGPLSHLYTPSILYAADPQERPKRAASTSGAAEDGPSQRPYETILPLAAALGEPGKPLAINQSFKKKDYPSMLKHALTRSCVVLICWQHEDIPLLNGEQQPGISQCLLDLTKTKAAFPIPASWPKDSSGNARYDLVFVFHRSKHTGKIRKFRVVPQFLLSGDGPYKPAG
jgi:hypothetical protein